MINLNKKLVSKAGILSYVQDIDIYRLYAEQEVDMSTNRLSPLRDEDSPSFGYFIGESDEICFKDFVLGSGDCITFVQWLLGLSFFEALSQIATDFNLTSHFHCKTMTKFIKKKETGDYKNRSVILQNVRDKKLQVRTRYWTAYDLLYWEQFGISKACLQYYGVQPIDYIFFNTEDKPVQADKYAYVFNEWKDGIHTIKIYQPFSKKFKWLNNHNDSIWQGWTQLPKNGKKLIITKSLKDVMSIVSVLGIPAVSLQSESVTPKQIILDELDARFETMYLLYDNDFDKDFNVGRALGAKIVEDQYITQLEIPDTYLTKDFSDLVKIYGQKEAEDIFKTRIEAPY